MIRNILIILSLILTLTAAAQTDVTTFMNVPVNGTRTSMVRKLLKAGLKKAGKDLLLEDVDGKSFIVTLQTNGKEVCRVTMTPTRGTGDVFLAVQMYNTLIECYRRDCGYCEKEYNREALMADSLNWKRYIKQGMYYAEFFQAADPQMYVKRVSFRLTEKNGEYCIERRYDNIYKIPNNNQITIK